MDRLSPDRARQILDAVRGINVLVIGDVMLDIYLRGGASRVSPEAPVPVVRVVEEWTALGGAANVAANLVALGAAVALVGAAGDDREGQDLKAAAAEQGIADGVVIVAGRPTTVKTRVLVGYHQVARYDREVDDDLTAADVGAFTERIESLAADADVIVLEDYDKGVLVPVVIEAALDAARRRGIPVVVDPKARHFFAFRGATVFKPNLAELEAALRAPVLARDTDWMQRTRRHLECENLLVTMGGQGMSLMGEHGDHLQVPAVARSVYDVSGAGDTVTALMAAVLGAGGTAPEAAVLATHAAGVEVGKAGVVTVEADEILASLSTQSTDSNGRSA